MQQKVVLPALCRTNFLHFSSHLIFQQFVCKVPPPPSQLLQPLPFLTFLILPQHQHLSIMPRHWVVFKILHQTSHSERTMWASFSHLCTGVWRPLRHVRCLEYLHLADLMSGLSSCRATDESQNLLWDILNGIRFLSWAVGLCILHIPSRTQLNTSHFWEKLLANW